MQNIGYAPEQTNQETQQPATIAIPVEFIAYLALALLGLVLRLANLDIIPLSDAEAHQALAAWRVVHPGAATIISQSPILFLVQSFSLTVFGGSEFAARIATVLAGVALSLTPALFRDLLGRTRAFLFSALLAFSPVLLLSSRSSSPAVWSMLFAALGLWAVWRWRTEGNPTPQPPPHTWRGGTTPDEGTPHMVAQGNHRERYAIMATIFAAALALLAEPGGIVLALILAGAMIGTTLMTRADDDMAADPPPELREQLRGWPWTTALTIAGGAVVLVSTGFMLFQPGLSAVAEVVGGFLRGITTPSPVLFYPLLVSLFYQPVLWIFAIIGVILLAREGTVGVVERFLAVWLVLAGVASLLYSGAGPDHALWLIAPLSGLASHTVTRLVAEDEHHLWSAPAWARWLLAGITIALLAAFSVSLEAISRSMMSSPVNSVLEVRFNPTSIILVPMALLFAIVGYFLAASVWDGATSLRGGALGLLIFGSVTALGAGWSAAVPNAANPVELWHFQTTSDNTATLRQTLTDLSQRQSHAFPEMPVVALAPQDGVVAWLLRDYSQTTFINDLSEAKGQAIIIVQQARAPDKNNPPDLGGSYVGETFTVSRAWNPETLRPMDLLTWWLQRQSRISGAPSQWAVLWLRQDIYQGSPSPVPGAR